MVRVNNGPWSIANAAANRRARTAKLTVRQPPRVLCRCALPDGVRRPYHRVAVCARCHLVVPVEGSCQ